MADTPAPGPLTVGAAYHFFQVVETVTDTVVMPGMWHNGLVDVEPGHAVIYTGCDTGPMTVWPDPRAAPPAVVDQASWDEIVEVSIDLAMGELIIANADYGNVEGARYLTVAGPGAYRLRVHARGRLWLEAAGEDYVPEEYLISCWPAPTAPEIVYQLTDDAGAMMRASAPPATG